MTPRIKKGLQATGLILVIAASLYSLYPYVAGPAESSPLHERLGEVMAEQTAELLAHTGKVAVITLHSSEFPILQAQLNGFKRALRRSRIQVEKVIVLDTKGSAKYGPGRGLSSQKFLRIRDHYRNVDALVSFVGVPDLGDQDLKNLQGPGPKIVAEAKFSERLEKLLENQIVQAAVVPRFVFPAPVSKRSHSAKDEFQLYFQVVRQPQPSATTDVAGDAPSSPSPAKHEHLSKK
jgi:hypothetical protein